MSDASVSLNDLLEAGCHFGHQKRRWNPKMKPFIYAERDGVHIFDLQKTAEGLERACKYVKNLVSEGGKLMFVGTKRQAKAIVKEEAQSVGAPYVTERWLGGTITNWEQIKKSIDKLLKMRGEKERGEYKKYTKKENVLIDREITRLERFLGGLTGLTKIPEAVFVVDSNREKVLVSECRTAKIKVVGLVDTNCDPDEVNYLIPANDDAVRSIKLLVSRVAKAYAEGRAIFEKKSSKKKE